MRTPRILVACEYSGIVRDAFAARGWDAWSCDLLPSERPGGNHYQGDVSDILRDGWDLMVAHPPCTYLALSGAKWLYEQWTEAERAAHLEAFHTHIRGHSPRPDLQRWRDMREGAQFFLQLWEADIEHIAIENPQMHGHAIKATGGRPTQFVQPYEYGTPESKRTGLRLKNLPPLTPNEGWEEVLAYGRTLPKKVFERVHHLPPSPTRWIERSRTFPGIAQAMADQWGPYVELSLDMAEQEQAA
jgi:hypothetical protein